MPSPEALERILEVSRQLARPFDLSELLTLVVDATLAILEAERGSVFLYEPATHELVSRVATGAQEIRFPADRGIAGECVKTREIVIVPDAYADPRFNPDVDRATGFRTRCLLTIPLIGHDGALVGVLQVLNKRDGVFDEADRDVASALAASCAVAIQRARLLAELVEKEKMERELAVAREIQLRVLPQTMPVLPGYEVAGWSRPADETGGDIFDLIERGGDLTVLVGDATGHGVGPALCVTQVRAMLRMALRLGAELDDAFTNINDQLTADLASNRFVTAFLGRLDTREHRLIYHSGGQGPILHLRAGEPTCATHTATTLPLGMIAGLPLDAPCVESIGPGDVVALITDGIFEYENAAEEAFGHERVQRLIEEHRADSAEALLQRIVDAVGVFAGTAPQGDDMTIVIVKRLPA